MKVCILCSLLDTLESRKEAKCALVDGPLSNWSHKSQRMCLDIAVCSLISWVIQPLQEYFIQSAVTQSKLDTGMDWKAFFFLVDPQWLIDLQRNFCKWENPSGISAAPSPNNTVGSSHCGMLGSLWLVYRVYRILCCLSNVVVGNLLCNSWNTIPSEVISGTQHQCHLTTVFLLHGGYFTDLKRTNK